MAALKALFQGVHAGRTETSPLERKYLVHFQECCRNKTGNLFKKSANGTVKRDKEMIPEIVEKIFEFPNATKRDWTIICTVIQWLGTPLGQWYLRAVRDTKR